MRALAQSADGATSLKMRTLALWVAQNRLAQAQLADPWPAHGITDGNETQAGVPFVWRQTVSDTPNPAFRKIDIVVAAPAQPDYALARLVGFLGSVRAVIAVHKRSRRARVDSRSSRCSSRS